MPRLEEYGEWLDTMFYSERTKGEYLRYAKHPTLSAGLTQEAVDNFCEANRNPVAFAFMRNHLRWAERSDASVSGIRLPAQRWPVSTRIPQYITYQEMEELANAADDEHAVMFRLMFEGGLRVSEVMDLGLQNVNAEKQTIRFIGKRNKEAIVSFGEVTKGMFEDYVRRRGITDRLFPSIRRSRSVINDYLEKLDWVLGRKVNPHAFRHGCATHLARKPPVGPGWDILRIKEYMRHDKLETTARYVHFAQMMEDNEAVKAAWAKAQS